MTPADAFIQWTTQQCRRYTLERELGLPRRDTCPACLADPQARDSIRIHCDVYKTERDVEAGLRGALLNIMARMQRVRKRPRRHPIALGPTRAEALYILNKEFEELHRKAREARIRATHHWTAHALARIETFPFRDMFRGDFPGVN